MRKLVALSMLGLLGFSGSLAQAGFLDGYNAFRAGDYCKARDEWKDDARSGDASAAFGMAELYARGYCYKEDQRMASQWYLTAAIRGYARARAEMGVRYAYGKGVQPDLFRSYVWLKAATSTTSSWDVESLKSIESNLVVIEPMVPPEMKKKAEEILVSFRKDYKLPREFEKLD
jgi:hypothetical protein